MSDEIDDLEPKGLSVVTTPVLKPTSNPSSRRKNNREIKDMILSALENCGGVSYLEECAKKQPVAFLTLLGKIIPLQAKITIKRDLDDLSDAELAAIARGDGPVIDGSGQEVDAPAGGADEHRSLH